MEKPFDLKSSKAKYLFFSITSLFLNIRSLSHSKINFYLITFRFLFKEMEKSTKSLSHSLFKEMEKPFDPKSFFMLIKKMGRQHMGLDMNWA